ncbi:MAG: cytochrome B [Bacteroidetes bacterium]|nr:MAG: cytochrome B [Bacteroidota bacterium]
MNLNSILVHTHSGLRWVALILIVMTVIRAGNLMSSKENFEFRTKSLALFAMIAMHIQAAIGLVLYVISPTVQFGATTMKDSTLRFFAVEHIAMMLIALVLFTIGYSKSKKKTENRAKYKTVFWFYLIGLLVVLASIPWPFRGLGAGWF